MARYGMDYGRDFGSLNQGSRYQGGSRGGWRDQEMGGMRSDGGWQSNWRDFPGEEGWYGGRRGYDQGYQSGRGQYGEERGGMRAYGQGQELGGEMRGGYGGRDMGYGEEMGSRGWQRQGRGGGKQMRASEIMTEDPQTVTPDATLADAAKKMKEMDVGLLPVVDGQDGRKLRGVITDRDIAIRAVAEGKDGKAKVSDCMTSRVSTVNKNDPVDRAVELMEREQVRRVPVTDREGRLVGIIAQADLALDYAEQSHRSLHRMAEMVERVSEPGHRQH